MINPGPPDPDRLVVQCAIPTLAARAVKLDTVVRRARASGLRRPSLRHAANHEAPTETRVTTHVDVARFIIDELRACRAVSSRGGGPAKRAVAIACGQAAAALEDAIRRAIDTPLGLGTEPPPILGIDAAQ